MLPHKKAPLHLLLALSILLGASARSHAETIEYDGLIEPYAVVDIGAPVEGIVAEVMVDRSSPVKEGQTLLALESSVEQAALEKAKAMATFDGEIGLQQTQLEFAKRVYDRLKELNAISAHDKDQAATEIVLTGYRLEKARENRALAELELKKAQAEMARRSIRSPITGVVVERYVSPGEYVNNQPLLRIAHIDPLRVEVIVPAQMFGKITPGMNAVIVPEIPEYGEKTATVTIIDKVIDSASNTFGVRLTLPNSGQNMPSGLRCQVKFDMPDKTAAKN